ncbi:hypothetical protein EDB89DRAFT_1841956 [Lactarius sanguifluus]|nr:hypothetical protein EDB89DRAFT_1841956 [Lactarius sanguifluus]
MTVLFRNLRIIGYVSVLLLASGVLGIASYLASQFLPHIRFSFTTYSLVVPSFTIAVLVVLFFSSRPWIDALFLLIMDISWLGKLLLRLDINGPADCYALASSRTQTVHGTISSKTFCYLSKILEGLSWAIFILLMFFLVLLITLANRSQVLGWPHIWREDIDELPWFGQYPGYPGFSPYTQYLGPQPSVVYSTRSTPASTPHVGLSQNLGDGGVIQHQPGHSIIIWPGVNGDPPRIEQRPGVVTPSTL